MNLSMGQVISQSFPSALHTPLRDPGGLDPLRGKVLWTLERVGV